MKNLITILILFVAVGCGKIITADDVVGTYEAKVENTFKYVFLKNGKVEGYKLFGEASWAIEQHDRWGDSYVHIIYEDVMWTPPPHSEWSTPVMAGLKDLTEVFKIEPNGDLTESHRIIYSATTNGAAMRYGIPHALTFKKVK